MKLFVITALIAVATAGRLEPLERSYLPPDNSIGVARSSFGSNGGLGGQGSHGSFGGNSGGFGAAGAGLPGRNAGGNIAGATSNQYLPPNHGASGFNGGSQFGGAQQGFGGQQNFRSQQYSSHQAAPAQQYGAPSSQFGSAQARSPFGASNSQFGSHGVSGSRGAPSYQLYGQQSAATSRQYLAPLTGSYQQPPQQAFDEKTGYQY